MGFDTVLLGALVSLFWFFTIIFRGLISWGAFLGSNCRPSLFTLKPVDFVPQFLILTFQFLVFLTEGLDKIEQFTDTIKRVFKAPDIVDVQIGYHGFLPLREAAVWSLLRKSLVRG